MMGVLPTAISEHLPLLAFLLPLAGAALILLLSSVGLAGIRLIALATAICTLVASLLIVVQYDAGKVSDNGSAAPIQMVSSYRWLGSPGESSPRETEPGEFVAPSVAGPDIRFAVGVDGISIWLILLASALAIPAIVAAAEVDRKSPPAFYALLLLLLGAAIGVFAALDVILFAICFEASAVAIYFLIGNWGGYDRRQVARKFFVYNLCGSVLVLIGLTGIVIAHGWMTATTSSPVSDWTFSIPRLVTEIPQAALQDAGAEEYWRHIAPWIFTMLLLGFAIKAPLIPFHTWMPDANHDAPSVVSVLLAGVALKFGFFGLIRFVVPLFPETLATSEVFLLPLAVLGSIFAALITLGHDDVKRVVTYSLLVQLELCAAAAATISPAGVLGALLQLVSSGLAIGALLFLVGELERRFQTRDIEAYSGLIHRFPRFSLCLAYFVFSLIGFPGLAGFPGSWLTMTALFQTSISALMGSIFANLLVTWAFLWMLQRMLLGKLRVPISGGGFLTAASTISAAGHENVRPRISAAHIESESAVRSLNAGAARVPQSPRDLSAVELVALSPSLILLLAIGLWPQLLVDRMEPTVRQMLRIENASGSTSNQELPLGKPAKDQP